MATNTASVILSQLGGGHFRVMTGSKNFVGDASSLSFKVGRNAKGVTNVKVKLDLSDTYTVTFYKVKRAPSHEVVVLAELDNIYADSLQNVFKTHTGLDTHL